MQSLAMGEYMDGKLNDSNQASFLGEQQALDFDDEIQRISDF